MHYGYFPGLIWIWCGVHGRGSSCFDPPGSSGSSSTPSGESTRQSCTKCLGRMSSFSLHKHLFCTKCHVCSDRILTCRIKIIRSPAKVGLVVTDLITSPVVSWEGWETPPPAPRLSCHSLLNHRRGKTSLSCGDLLAVVC